MAYQYSEAGHNKLQFIPLAKSISAPGKWFDRKFVFMFVLIHSTYFIEGFSVRKWICQVNNFMQACMCLWTHGGAAIVGVVFHKTYSAKDLLIM